MSDFYCPLQQVEVENDDTGERFVGRTVLCGKPLHLVWSFSWPISSDPFIVEHDGSIEPVEAKDIPSLAYTDSWRVECENGHVLATHSRSADDCAEPFDLDAVMEAIGASQGLQERGCVLTETRIPHGPHVWRSAEQPTNIDNHCRGVR